MPPVPVWHGLGLCLVLVSVPPPWRPAAMSGAWLRRKVCHPWDGGPHRLTMYFATLDLPNVSNRPLVRPDAVRLLQAAAAAGGRNPDTAASTQRPAAARAAPSTAFTLDRPR